MVTAATLYKTKLFCTSDKLEALHDVILQFAESFGWELHAWAVFANHYHFVGTSPEVENAAGLLVAAIHRRTARDLNAADGRKGRRVWYRSWATRVTHNGSYLARTAYVMWNPAKHGLAADPESYPWCSMGWFRREGRARFVESVLRTDTSRLQIIDDF